MTASGRSCPLDYRYSLAALDRVAEIEAETLYVIGGLYGNYPALEAILALRDHEDTSVTLVFNGDFNWFNVDNVDFANVNTTVLEHAAIRGNVEAELIADTYANGCGCAYPDWVDETVVVRSNAIMERLRTTALTFPGLRRRLLTLPMHLVAQVGALRVGIVHGDAESLAGWGFAWEKLRKPAQDEQLAGYFEQGQVRVFACTHTCLPIMHTVRLSEGLGVIANNGSAGMPNFHGTRYGVITRIGTQPWAENALYGICVEGIYIQALPLYYDHAHWVRSFLANWPPGTPAHTSYFQRIVHGPDFQLSQAVSFQHE